MIELEHYRSELQQMRERATGPDVLDLADWVLALCDALEAERTETALARREVEELRDFCTVMARRVSSSARELAIHDIAVEALPADARARFRRELARVEEAATLPPKEKPSGEIER